MPAGKVPNHIFKGTDSLQFLDKSTDWGFEAPTFSNGAAYADLDNDGDLDLIINNINDPTGIYRNNSEKQLKNYFLTVQLQGEGQNTFGYGTKIILKHNGKQQTNYVTGTQGFQSSVSQNVHFGLGVLPTIDTLEIIWPDNRVQVLTQVKSKADA